MSINLGIVGAGGIGKAHLASAKKVGVNVVCIADVNGAMAKEVATANGVPNHTDDPQKLFNDKSIQAVVIGTPNKFHAPLAIAALQAGKDVLVEKPMAMNAGECRQMIDARDKSGKILQVGFVQRYSAVATTARAFIDAGRLGNIYHVKANYYRRRGIPGLGGWFTTKALSGGGPLIDLGVHIIDLVMHLMKYPKPVRASGKVYAKFGADMKHYLYESMWAGPPRYDGKCDVEDSAHALIRLEGGATLEMNTTWAGNFPENAVPNIIGLFGDKGGITFNLGGDKVQIACEDLGHNVDLSPKLRTVVAFDEQMKHFADNVVNRTKPHATGENGMTVQSILDAIYKSSELDREVEM
jgi:predicted dehydrogenase